MALEERMCVCTRAIEKEKREKQSAESVCRNQRFLGALDTYYAIWFGCLHQAAGPLHLESNESPVHLHTLCTSHTETNAEMEIQRVIGSL